jgi:hypothetical protein
VLTATGHLVDDLHVPAILAYLETGDLLKAFSQYGAPNGVFFLTPSGANSTLATQKDNGLIWHMLGLPSDVAPTYAALLAALEVLLRGQGVAELRVALVAGSGAFDFDLTQALEPLLVFNGRAASQQPNTYLQRTLSASRTAEDVAGELLTFEPNVIISTTDAGFNGVVEQVETRWPSAAGPRPYYVLSPINYGTMTPILEAATAQSEMARRLLGVNVAGSEDRDLYRAYEDRLTERFRDAVGGAENVYDSLYFLAYAMLAGGTLESVSGADIPIGMRSLITGSDPFTVGPDDAVDVMSALALRPPKSIRLDAVSGPAHFNPDSGVRLTTGSVFCTAVVGPTQAATVYDHVGHYDMEVTPHVLRLARAYSGPGVLLPCLGELALPEAPP